MGEGCVCSFRDQFSLSNFHQVPNVNTSLTTLQIKACCYACCCPYRWRGVGMGEGCVCSFRDQFSLSNFHQVPNVNIPLPPSEMCVFFIFTILAEKFDLKLWADAHSLYMISDVQSWLDIGGVLGCVFLVPVGTVYWWLSTRLVSPMQLQWSKYCAKPWIRCAMKSCSSSSMGSSLPNWQHCIMWRILILLRLSGRVLVVDCCGN